MGMLRCAVLNRNTLYRYGMPHPMAAGRNVGTLDLPDLLSYIHLGPFKPSFLGKWCFFSAT